MTPSTPKSQVILAGDAPVAAIFYRKSHRTTYCLRLDYEKRGERCRDRLSKGSRFYGRIFPLRSNLSPDGSLLVYFAMRGRKSGGSSDPATWTAVCTPPWLKAHLFFPNGSTWGGGGIFLRDHRLVVFDTPPVDAGAAYEQFRGYTLLRDTKSLPPREKAMLEAHFRPPAKIAYSCPAGTSGPVLVRMEKPGHSGDYDRFDYVLQDKGGKDIEGAEDIVLANWAGWDVFGRLMVASGRYLKIYEVEPGRRLPKPGKVLDLEAAL